MSASGFAAVMRGGVARGVMHSSSGSDFRATWEWNGILITGEALPELLAIVPEHAVHLGDTLVPTAGSWERIGDSARFIPRFVLPVGAVFVVLSRQDARGDWSERARVSAPGVLPNATTVVESIDPAGEQIPANLLRFSVTFSSVMEEGSAAGRIHLHDASGAESPGIVMEMPPELWDRDRRRLTVLLEPGRIKRGLQPNVIAGPPFREGEMVTVVVDAGIRDSSGAELVAGAERTYRVCPAVRSRVDPRRWDIRWPDTAGEALVIRFDRPMDRALVRRCLRVVDGHGHPSSGSALLDDEATGWTFAAAPVGARLHIDTRLEDLAGNSVRRVFDRDLRLADQDGIDASVVVLTRDGRVELRD